MQNVFWTDDDVPPVIPLENGDTQFFDYPYWNGFQIGDQIIHLSEIGPSVYRVVDLEPEYDEHDAQEMYRVTIRGV